MARLKEETIDRDLLLDSFLDEGEIEFNSSLEKPIPILKWVEHLDLGGRKFSLEDHPYQRDMLTEIATRQCFKKGSQVGITEVNVIRSIKGLLDAAYPQGVLYLFPTQNDVSDFSKSRFNPVIADNPQIARYVQATDAVSIKRVRKSHLYLRGARSTGKIEGIKKTSSQLKSVPVDRIVFDEVDEFEPVMVELALERLGHSTVKEEIYLSTPSIPDYGIDKLYAESDQRVWMIKCAHCGTETCLELEFPSCLIELSDGKVIRACKKCKKEIFPKDGHWIPLYPDRSKDLVGWWISQLNSAYVEPQKILKAFNELTGRRQLQEFYNSKLGMAYISAENRLTINDIYINCGLDPIQTKDVGPCAMGVDVGAMLHVVVGFKPRDRVLQICFIGRVSSFNDVHDIAKRFNVKCAVIDIEPETRKVREFAEAEPYQVYLCDYVSSSVGTMWNPETKIVKVNRTESLDGVHDLFIQSGKLILPRKCEEVEMFSKQLTSIAKVLEENPETGSREYRWRKIGEDHFAHATNYFVLASKNIDVSQDPWFIQDRKSKTDHYDTFYDPFAKGEKSDNRERDYDPFGSGPDDRYGW